MGEVKRFIAMLADFKPGQRATVRQAEVDLLSRRVKLYRQEGWQTEIDFSGDLCVDCYDKILKWIEGLKVTSDSENTIDVIPTLVTTPVI